MTEWRIEPLGSNHVRSEFACGVPTLDEFIRLQISQYERRGLGRSYVIVDHSSSRVAGYYTLAASALTPHELPHEVARRLPRHPVPVVLLARLAVDHSHQNAGLGSRLLKDAITRAVRIAKEVGAYAIHVEAVDERAAAFYRHFGFSPSPNPLSLFLPMSTFLDSSGNVSGRPEIKSAPPRPKSRRDRAEE